MGLYYYGGSMALVSTPNGYFQNHLTRYYTVSFPGDVVSPIKNDIPPAVIGWTALTSDRVDRSSLRDYKVMIAKKLNATNSYERIIYRSVVNQAARCSWGPKPNLAFFLTKSYGSSSWRWVPDAIVGPFTFESDESVRDQALARLKRKLASNQGNFGSMIPLAEIHQLRGSIKQAANMAKDLIEALAKIRKTKGRSASRYAAGVWLNFNFGILPVLNDAAAAAASIDSFLRRNDRNLVVSGTSEKRWSTSLKQTNITGCPVASVKLTAEYRHRLLYSYRCGFALKVSAGNNYSVFEHLGFNFADLPAVGWELIPYSWVVDYFTTAGEFFADVFQSPPGDVIYLSLAHKYNLTATASFEHYQSPDPDNVLNMNVGGSAETEHMHFQRSSLGSIPHRALRFKTVDEIGLHSITKVINLASILLK